MQRAKFAIRAIDLTGNQPAPAIFRDMAEDRYAATWRGARKYQFDEETRRKRRALYWRTLKPWLVAGALLCAAAFLAVYLMPSA